MDRDATAQEISEAVTKSPNKGKVVIDSKGRIGLRNVIEKEGKFYVRFNYSLREIKGTHWNIDGLEFTTLHL